MKTCAFIVLMLFGVVAQAQQTTPIPPRKGTVLKTAVPVKEAVVEPEYPLDLARVGLTLPETEDQELNRIFKSPRTIFYKLPSIWQHYIPASHIEHSNLTLGTKSYTTTQPKWGIYFAPFLSDFNANPLFPWETTIGLNSTHKENANIYRTVNFINLPDNAPILILNDYPIKWIYPNGTTVGEVIYVLYEEKRYIQEIRTRQKMDDATGWEPRLYRPISDRAEYMALTGVKSYTPAKRYMFFRNPQEDEVFKMEGMVERLPPLATTKVKDLLARPFKEVSQSAWSPAADQDFHILPKDYCFSLLEVDSVSCANCHRQTQTSVLNLVPREPLIINNPSKVGNIRGSDAVFTWHPFTNSSIRNNDQEPEPKLNLRKYDTQYNFVKVLRYGEKPTGYEAYKLTEFVQDSLKDYELPNAQFLHSKTK